MQGKVFHPSASETPVSVSGMAWPGKIRGFDRIIGKSSSAIMNTELDVIITRVQLSRGKTLNHDS